MKKVILSLMFLVFSFNLVFAANINITSSGRILEYRGQDSQSITLQYHLQDNQDNEIHFSFFPEDIWDILIFGGLSYVCFSQKNASGNVFGTIFAIPVLYYIW